MIIFFLDLCILLYLVCHFSYLFFLTLFISSWPCLYDLLFSYYFTFTRVDAAPSECHRVSLWKYYLKLSLIKFFLFRIIVGLISIYDTQVDE